jgi:hypothetical protein
MGSIRTCRVGVICTLEEMSVKKVLMFGGRLWCESGRRGRVVCRNIESVGRHVALVLKTK